MTSRLTVIVAAWCGILACGTGVPPRTHKPHIPCALSRGASMALNVDFAGVWTNPNPHSKVPAGATRIAENVVSTRPGVASTVPGQENLAAYSASDERFSSGINYQGCLIENTSGATPKLYVRDLDANTLTPETGSFEPPTGVERMPFAVAGDKLYMLTSAGLKVKDGVGAAPAEVGTRALEISSFAVASNTGGYFSGSTAASGTVTLAAGAAGQLTIVVDGTSVGPIAYNTSDAQTALDAIIVLNADATFAAKATASSGGSGVITITWDTEGTTGNGKTLTASRTAGTATTSGPTLTGGTDPTYAAYRYTIIHTDSQGVRQESAPSGRQVFDGAALVPASVTTAVSSITAILPAGLVSGDIIRLYRTEITTTTPGDVMYLVYERELTGSERSNRIATISDATPDELRGEPLYTNGTRESISRQNERPPYAKVMLGFDDSLLLANVRAPQRFTLRLLAQPTLGDVLTIAGLTYTAADEFAIYTDGTFWADGYPAGTVSQQIAHAAANLAHAINIRSGSTLYAQYVSGVNDAPGIIEIETRSVTTAAFTVEASANGDRYEPQITTAQSSLATTEPNGIWVSKRGQHYAFPPLRSSSATYRFRVGVKGNPILAMAVLREAVIVFVQNEGVFRVQRAGESWRVDQISNNAHLLVPSSVGVMDNRVIALTTRGLVAVDISGVEEIDLPIKDQIDSLKGVEQNVLQPLTFAVTDEGRLRYTLYHPLTNSSTTSDHAWVYNGDTDLFTERTDAASGGLVGEDDGLLYLGDATSNHLTRERTGSASAMYKRPDNTAIPVRLKWTVMDEGDPGAMKQYAELRLLTKDAITGDVTFNCTNDLGGSESTTGSTSSTGEPYVRVWVPDGCQMTSRLDVEIQRSVLGQSFEVVGLKALVPGVYDGGLTR